MNTDNTYNRTIDKLRKDLGEVFLSALADPETVEIILNADGTWKAFTWTVGSMRNSIQWAREAGGSAARTQTCNRWREAISENVFDRRIQNTSWLLRTTAKSSCELPLVSD